MWNIYPGSAGSAECLVRPIKGQRAKRASMGFYRPRDQWNGNLTSLGVSQAGHMHIHLSLRLQIIRCIIISLGDPCHLG
jgi:hypothetical protein